MKKIGILTAATLALASAVAQAVPVYTSNLQNELNNLGLGHYDAVTSQAQAPYWLHSAVGANSQFVFTDVGFGGAGNSLGIYSLASGEKLELFDESATSSASVSFLADGSARAVQVDNNGVELNTTVASFGDIFGFYVTYGAGTFYSDPSKNPTYTAGDGNDYQDWMLAFQGDGSDVNAYNGFAGGPMLEDDWLFAFDGLLHGPGQLDFNDAMFFVESVNPIPVPAAVWLFGTGLLGLVGVARRRA